MQTRTIEAAVNSKLPNPYVSLYKGEGYWYFVYDDPNSGIYRTRSVYVYRLNELTLEQWLDEAAELTLEVENTYYA